MKKFFTPQEKYLQLRWCKTLAFTTLMLLFITTTLSAQDSTANTINANNRRSSNVNLQLFTGGYSSGFVQMNWTTTSENEMSHFEVERSTDGTNFRQIGKVLAKGDKEVTSNYTFLDILAEKGSNFYRLVMIDKDGNLSYSKMITISVEKGLSLFVVYPNPFGKRVQVKFRMDNDDQVTMNIINEAGAVIRTQHDPVTKGDNLIIMRNVDNLPPGIYYLEVISKDKKLRTKLVKQQTE